ncbi:zf-CCHC domain-containing protein [Tanacetum coccineum]
MNFDPYDKCIPPKCFRCGSPGHRSNACPNRKLNACVGENHEGNTGIDPTKFEDFSQRNKIFETKCLIEDNVCSLLIDGGSCENLVSKELVKALKLPTEQHPYPCELDSIKKCPGVEVNEIFKIPIVVGSSYRDVVACDVVDLSASSLQQNEYFGSTKSTLKNKENRP